METKKNPEAKPVEREHNSGFREKEKKTRGEKRQNNGTGQKIKERWLSQIVFSPGAVGGGEGGEKSKYSIITKTK